MDRDEQIRQLLTKGVEQVLPSAEFLKSKLGGNDIMTVYAGFDPTAPTLHIGHAIQLRKLRHFQDLGHKIIFLVGDFTARIGDPTDKLAARVQLSEKQIKANMRLYKQQAGKFIRFSGKNAATVKYNNKWLGRLKFADVLSLASHMTVDQMQKRDMFVRRSEEGKPIYLHEFLYPLMQGYDSIAMNVDGEVGGNDQLFNMMAGRTLLKQIKDREKFVVTTKLLTDPTGKKMGKTEGNAVSLCDLPQDIYGKVMSWPDTSIKLALELCTDMGMEEIDAFLLQTPHPRDQKARLAFEIVKSVYSEKDAIEAQAFFVDAFQKKEIPEAVLEVKADGSQFRVYLSREKIIPSNSELKRLADAGAIVHLDSEKTLSFEDTKKVPEKGTYRIGKSRFIRIV